MAEAGTVNVDGKRTRIHFHTGTVTATRKQKETQIYSGAQVNGNQGANVVTSTTVDHHELLIVDASGRERAFNMVNMDLACRDGHTVTVVWVVPEGVEAGPHIEVFNHSTGDRTTVAPERILGWFIKPNRTIWGSTAACFIVGTFIAWWVAFIALFAPYLYFKRRALNAVKGMLASSELKQLETQLEQVKPIAAVAA